MRFFSLLLLLSLMSPLSIFAEVQIMTSPTPEHIRPDLDLVKTTLFMPAGSTYQITVDAPSSSWWISTDFPVVESTRLYQFQGVAQDGKVEFETIYPIRGTYRLAVIVNGERQDFTLSVAENTAEVLNGVSLVAVIFLAGLIGGQIFLRTARAESALAIGLLACLFLLTAVPDETQAITEDGHWLAQSGDYVMEVRFDPAATVVGQNVSFIIEVKKEDVLLSDPLSIEIETFHMEDETVMFHGTFTAPSGKMEQSIQFFDGANTRTTFTVTGLEGVALSTQGVIEVEGIGPPTAVIWKTMALLSLVTIGGLLIGFFLIPGNKKHVMAV